MSPERFSTEFALLVTYKIRISDMSQIRNVLNPESKVQNLYMKPLVGVDESTLVQSERPEQETNIRPSLSTIRMLRQ